MKITLLTTLSGLVETSRIKEEIEKRGDTFCFVDLKNFQYEIFDEKISVPHLDELLSSDVVIVRGIFNALKSITALISYLRAHGVAVFDNNLSAHPYSIDKVVDVFKLALNEVPTPNTVYVRTFDEYARNIEKVGYPAIVKSTRTGKGAGVYKFDTKEAAQNYVDELKASDVQAKSLLIQSFVPYEYDLRVLVIGDSMFGMRRIPKEGEFRANFSLGGSVEVFPLTDEIRALATKAINAIGLNVAGVDVLIEKSGKMYILEVNHTPGFEGMEQATGENIGKTYVDYAIANARAN